MPYSTYKRWTQPDPPPRKTWPQPKRTQAIAQILELPSEKSHWGHRKVWAYYWHESNAVSMSTVERAMRGLGCLQPVAYQHERKQLALGRRAAFEQTPVWRNRVLQMDVTEFETINGGIWRIHNVMDYATKYNLASLVRATATASDAIDALHAALAEARRVTGLPIILDCFDDDDEADAFHPVYLVTDNGPCYKSGRFAKVIDRHVEIVHVRTRRKSPHTNGVVERYGGSLKYERLYRHEIADGIELAQHCASYREEYNHDRPHEGIALYRPADVYAAGSLKLKTAIKGSQP